LKSSCPARAGHPRPRIGGSLEAWMAGPKPGMTTCGGLAESAHGKGSISFRKSGGGDWADLRHWSP
jgi:hypothetical protein